MSETKNNSKPSARRGGQTGASQTGASLAGAEQQPISHPLPAKPTMCSRPAALGTLPGLCARKEERAALPLASPLGCGLEGAIPPGNMVSPLPLRIAHSPYNANGVGTTGGLGPGREGRVCHTAAVLQNELLLLPGKGGSSLFSPESPVLRWGTLGTGFPGCCCNVRGKSSLRAGVGSLEGAWLRGCLPVSPRQGGPGAQPSLCLRSRLRGSGAGSEHKATAAPGARRDPKAKTGFS